MAAGVGGGEAAVGESHVGQEALMAADHAGFEKRGFESHGGVVGGPETSNMKKLQNQPNLAAIPGVVCHNDAMMYSDSAMRETQLSFPRQRDGEKNGKCLQGMMARFWPRTLPQPNGNQQFNHI